jgi:hypothetical protein
MNIMTIGIVQLILFFLNHVEALKRKCHKKVIVVQMRNFIVEILKHYSFYTQCHFFFFPIKKLDHVKFG